MNTKLIWSSIFLNIVNNINKALKVITLACLIGMVILISFQIIVRFILPKLGFSASFPWTEELARYLMVWVVFLGGALAARSNMLIAVLALVNALPDKLAKITQVLSLLSLIVFFLYCAWVGLEWTEFGAGEISPAMKASKFWLYLCLPVGFALAAINSSAVLIESEFKNNNRPGGS